MNDRTVSENELREHWADAIQSVLDGSADAETRARLEAAMRADDALLRIYYEQATMNAELDRTSLAVLDGDLARLLAAPRRSAFRLPRFVLALAASLLVCLVVAALVVEGIRNTGCGTGMTAVTASRLQGPDTSISEGDTAAGSATASPPNATRYTPQTTTTRASATSQTAISDSPSATQQEVAEMNTLTNTLAAAASAMALAAMPMATTAAWTYTTTNAAATAGTLTDGTWALTATNTGSAVTVTGYTSYSGTGGVLDLSTGLNGGYALTSVGGSAFYSHASPSSGTNILPMTSIILPETLVSLQDWAFYSALPTALNPLSSVVVRGSALRSVGTRAFDFQSSNNNDSQRLPLTNDIACLVQPGVTNIGMKAFLALKSICGKLTLTNIQSIGTYAFFNNTRLQALDIASPTLTVIPDACFLGDTSITNAVFNVPNLRSVGALVFGNTDVAMSMIADIAQICPPGVTNVGDYALANCKHVSGELALTNLVSLGSGGHQFQGNNLTRIDLKGPLQVVPTWCFLNCDLAKEIILDCPALTNICPAAFYSAGSWVGVSNLVIGAKGPVTIANDAFTCSYYAQDQPWHADALTSVIFYGPAPDAASLANLMVRVSTNNSTHTCTIYASAKQAGWLEIAAAPNAAEAPNAPKGCFGVYTNSAGRKAWLVNRKSPYDSQVPGFSIRICDNDIGISCDRLSGAPAPASPCSEGTTLSRRLPVRRRM